MTTPVFTNNASTTLAVDTTASATTITVVDASIFNTLIQDGAGATNGTHEMATLFDGTNREVVKVTNANTTTEVITVVREQEGTTGYAFLIGDTVKLDLTADEIENLFFGALPIAKDSGQTDEIKFFSGKEIIIFSQEESFLSTGTNVVSLTVPSGSSFFVDEVGLVLTSTDTVTVSPEISFGDSGTSTLLLAATVTTGTNAKDRDKYTAYSTDSINTPDGLTSLTMSVTTVATATTCLGRVYFKGMLVEDE